MFVSTCKYSYVKILTLYVILLKDGASHRWLGQEGRLLVSKTDTLMEEGEVRISHQARTPWEGTVSESETGPSPDAEPTGTLILNFQPLELPEINFHSFTSNSVYSILLESPNRLRNKTS